MPARQLQVTVPRRHDSPFDHGGNIAVRPVGAGRRMASGLLDGSFVRAPPFVLLLGVDRVLHRAAFRRAAP